MSKFQSFLASSLRFSQLAKQDVARVQRTAISQDQLASWMPGRTGRLSVGVGRRHPVNLRKASLRTLSKRRECALRHKAGVQYSAVE